MEQKRLNLQNFWWKKLLNVFWWKIVISLLDASMMHKYHRKKIKKGFWKVEISCFKMNLLDSYTIYKDKNIILAIF